MLLAKNHPLVSFLEDAHKLLNSSNPLSYKGHQFNVDIKELPTEYMLLAELPGVSKENVKINVDKGHLTISIDSKSEEKLQEGETYLHIERNLAKKARSFYFGEDIDENNIKAQYLDGVLQLNIPKKTPEITLKEINID